MLDKFKDKFKEKFIEYWTSPSHFSQFWWIMLRISQIIIWLFLATLAIVSLIRHGFISISAAESSQSLDLTAEAIGFMKSYKHYIKMLMFTTLSVLNGLSFLNLFFLMEL